METYLAIFALLVAIILVAVKLILEHQRDLDRANGCEQEREAYTMKGMLRLMREERKSAKYEKRMKRLEQKMQRNIQIKKQHLSVTSFHEQKDAESTK